MCGLPIRFLRNLCFLTDEQEHAVLSLLDPAVTDADKAEIVAQLLLTKAYFSKSIDSLRLTLAYVRCLAVMAPVRAIVGNGDLAPVSFQS